MSCKTGKNFLTFESLLLKELSLNAESSIVPAPFVAVGLWVAASRGLCRMPYKELESRVSSICPPDMVHDAVSFLHRAGALFWLEGVSDTVVLDVQWIADAFSSIISFKHSWPHGKLKLCDLDVVWKAYSKEEREDVLQLFLRHQLAFLLPDDQHLMVPGLLPASSQNKFGYASKSGRHFFRMPVVPIGLLGRLLVYASQIPEWKIEDSWREGLVLVSSSKDASCCVRVSRGEIIGLQLDLLHGEAVFLQELVSAVDEVLTGSYSLLLAGGRDLERFLICPHCLATESSDPVKFAYAKVLRMIFSEEREIVCGGEKVSLDLFAAQMPIGVLKMIDADRIGKHHFIYYYFFFSIHNLFFF
jgi:hypothetical protein